MQITIPKQALEIIKAVEKAGYEIYIVGGAVRDIMIGRPTYDWDFATNATPEEIKKLFEDSYYDNDYGMVGIPNEEKDERPYEITTYRTEHGYTDARRPDKVKWGESLESDLERRDFTINAMALKMLKEQEGERVEVELIDLHGGKEDLDDKLIRTVGTPKERFSEDALRMMRAVRIASELNFKIEEKTNDAIKENVKLLDKIAVERIKDELFKLLASPTPYEGMQVALDSGILDQILPDFTKNFGVEQKSPGRHHIHDVGTHSMLSLRYCKSTDPLVRFATLIHDIGKADTYKKLPNGTITFYNHEVVGARIAKSIAQRLKFSKKETEKLWILVRYHQFTVDEHQSDKAIRRFIKNVGQDNIEDMLILRTADRLGSGAKETSWRTEEFKERIVEVQKQPFSVQDLKIDGDDIMKELNINPGPEVGEILEKLFNEVVEGNTPNIKDDLLEKLKSLV